MISLVQAEFGLFLEQPLWLILGQMVDESRLVLLYLNGYWRQHILLQVVQVIMLRLEKEERFDRVVTLVRLGGRFFNSQFGPSHRGAISAVCSESCAHPLFQRRAGIIVRLFAK